MGRLDDYKSALLAANPETSAAALARALDAGGPRFVAFIVDHGLGPTWHARTKREEFRESRLAAEGIFLAQEQALQEIDGALVGAGVKYAVIKGAATRLLVYENPAIRACHDLDLLVNREDRQRAAGALIQAGFTAAPEEKSISRELVLSRGVVDVDLHWGLLREGRLRTDYTTDILGRRLRMSNVWMLNSDGALFVLLVHPAFAKHLDGWAMGLHRVADIVAWLRTQAFDWQQVRDQLKQNGVKTAAWATLRWVQLLNQHDAVPGLAEMIDQLKPGPLRRAWLDFWLRQDLSSRASRIHWVRLLGFSMFLHDRPSDALRAFRGRRAARRRITKDLAAFSDLT